MTIILIIISLILDGYLSVIFSNSSYFIPLLTLSTLYLIYPLYKKNTNNYIFTVIITGLIYDLLYTNLLFFHAIIFYLVSQIIIRISKKYNQQTLSTILNLIFIITIYEIVVASIFFIFRVTTITLSNVIIKILKSLTLNIIYAIILKQFLKYLHN